MYDPEEACNENENAANKEETEDSLEQNDEKWAEIDTLTAAKTEEDGEASQSKEEKMEEDEEEPKVAANSPRTRRGATAVKNGVGSKTKKARK